MENTRPGPEEDSHLRARTRCPDCFRVPGNVLPEADREDTGGSATKNREHRAVLEMEAGGTNLPQAPKPESPRQLRDVPDTGDITPTATAPRPAALAPLPPAFVTGSKYSPSTESLPPASILLFCLSKSFSSGWTGEYLLLTKRL